MFDSSYSSYSSPSKFRSSLGIIARYFIVMDLVTDEDGVKTRRTPYSACRERPRTEGVAFVVCIPLIIEGRSKYIF